MAVEVANGIAKDGHRKTYRPEEYVGYLLQWPITTEPITGYDIDAARIGHSPGEHVPILTNPVTMQLEEPPQVYQLNPATAADPLAETRLMNVTVGRSQQEIWVSGRNCSITQWISTFPAFGIGPVNWFNSDGWNGFGVGMHANERLQEARDGPYQNDRNPTHGGAFPPPSALPDLDKVLRCPVSPPLHYDFLDAASGYVAGAVVPIEFDGVGDQNFGAPHGGSQTRYLCYWREKEFQRVDFHYGGREFIHRATSWYYAPREFDAGDFGPAVPPVPNPLTIGYGHTSSGLGISEIGLNEAYGWKIDPNDLTLRPIKGLGDGTTTDTSLWVLQDDGLFYNGDAGDVYPDEPAVAGPNEPLAVILRRTSDDFALACMVMLKPRSANPNITRVGRHFGINRVQFSERIGTVRNPALPPQAQAWRFTMVCLANSVAGRNAGWVSNVVFWFVGPFSECQNAILNVYSAGLLNQVPDPALLPANVKAGTELAGSVASTGTPGNPVDPGSQGGASGGPAVVINPKPGQLARYLKNVSRLK